MSINLKDCLIDNYEDWHSSRYSYGYNPFYYNSNPAFSYFMYSKFDNNEIEIPIVYDKYIYDYILNRKKSNLEIPDILYYSIASEPNTLRRKSFDSLIKNAFNKYSYNNNFLIKLDNNNNISFYGGRGMIFDIDMNPLLLCTKIIKFTDRLDTSSSDVYRNNIEYITPMCYISRKVFEDSKSFINKGIINRLLPLLSTINIYYRKDRSQYIKNVEIKIRDISNMIVCPECTLMNRENDIELNNLILNNYEKINPDF